MQRLIFISNFRDYKHCTSKILDLKLIMAWKQHANLFYFDRAATDLDWPLANGRFGSVAVLCD